VFIDGVPVGTLQDCLAEDAPVVAIASFSFVAEMRKAVRRGLRTRRARVFAPRTDS